jgi:hypothetical protein
MYKANIYLASFKLLQGPPKVRPLEVNCPERALCIIALNFSVLSCAATVQLLCSYCARAEYS